MGDGKETNSDFDKAFYNDLDEIDALHEELIPLSQDEPDQTHQESTVLSRFRVLLMHIICYLYSSDVDYEMMMMYLRELLDWLEEQSEVHALVLPPDKYSDIPIVSKIKRVLSSESDLEFDIDEIIRDCISETITEEEMNAKLPTLEVVAIAHNSTQNPLCIWEQMFDPSDFGIDKFILPLQGGKFGVLIQLMILQSLKGKSYDARVRTIILVCSQILKVDHATVRAYEDAAINTIAETNKYKKKRTRMGVGAMATVGLAAAGGAAIMTFTGGLAAPFVVAGLSSIVGTSSVAFLGTTAGLAAVAATFGAVGGGLTGYKVSKLVGSIEEFEFVPLKSEPSASLTIAVNGWVKSSKEISAENWQVLNHTGEQYILKYEGRYLAAFSNALNRFLTDFAVSVAADEMIKNTILATLASSLAWPVTILSLASVIDNPWSVCLKRSKSVGVHLAEVLTSRVHGDRPVSLIGYGLGNNNSFVR